jgi:hypothetical protein
MYAHISQALELDREARSPQRLEASAMAETVDDLFPTTSGAVRVVLSDVRKLVRRTAPDATKTF